MFLYPRFVSLWKKDLRILPLKLYSLQGCRIPSPPLLPAALCIDNMTDADRRLCHNMSLVKASYLWGMVSTDDRAEDRVDQEPEGIPDPPGSTFIGKVSDGSEHLLQGAVVCQSNPHPASVTRKK